MTTFRVATLNIWNRCGPWEQRLAAIRAELPLLAPDVISLQEVLRAQGGTEGPDQAEEIARGLGYHVAFGSAHEQPIALGNAVLSKFPIVRSEVFPLPTTASGRADERRCLLFAELDAPFARVPFFATHLDWKLHDGHVREAQVVAIADRVKALAPLTGFPPIVAGDFNAEPDSDEMRYLRGLCSLGTGKRVYFADVFAVAGDGSPGVTYSKTNPFAAAVHEPERRIDYVYVRGPDQRLRGAPLEARVCFDRPIEGVYPSDHFGVIATIGVGG